MISLEGKTIAIIATDGFEESELMDPVQALHESGATYQIIAPKPGQIRGWKGKEWTKTIPVHRTFDSVSVAEFDGLVIPGGTLNCDKLRMDENAVAFTREFAESGKPICAICHGPQLLIEADAARGRELTSYRGIRTDLINAGARWVDKEVVVDRGLVTSRSPEDLPAFIEKMIEEFAEEEPRQRRSAR